jgi:hypothetical protein
MIPRVGWGGWSGSRYDGDCLNVVMIQLSVDYLIINPLEVMGGASCALRNGGRIAIIFSNRLLLSKAERRRGLENIRAKDLLTVQRRVRDRTIVGGPLYVVTATKGR